MSKFTDDLEKVLVETGITVSEEDEAIRFPIFYGKEFEQISVDNLNLQGRCANVMKHNGIMTFGDLMEKWETIAGLRNCGVITRKDIKTGFLSYWYDNISDYDRKRFWTKFVKENY